MGGDHDAGVSTDSLGIIDERRRKIDRLKAQPPRVYGYGRDGGSHACGANRARTTTRTRRWSGGHGGFHHRALDGRGHGADRDIRPEAVRRSSPACVRSESSAHFRRSTLSSTISKSPGAGARRQGNGSGIPDSHVSGRGSRIHSPFEASVSPAHGIHSAAIAGSPAYRSGHRQDIGAKESKRTAVYFDRPEHGDRGGERVDQGVSHGGFPGDRICALPDHGPAKTLRQPATAGRPR